MVQVEIWSLTLASVKAVGSIAVMAAGGFLMTRLGIITNDVRKGLGELSMNLLLPCLMFSQVIYCNSKEMGGDVCPNMAQVIMSSADLFIWPIVVVTSGYCLGFLAAKLLRVPENFRRAAAGSVAFGNSTGMPVVLLSTLAPSLVAEGVVKGDPLLFLPVYLVLSPLLQWTVGSYIFQGPKVTATSSGDVENPAPAADVTAVASIPSIPEASIPEADIPPMDSNYSAKSVPIQVTRAATSHAVFREVPESREEVRFQTISFGIEPPLKVGPGLSAQAELEDVLTPEDVQLPCQRERCGKRLKRILFMFLSPPVAATLLGILVAFIRPLQNQFVNLNDWTLPDKRALDWAYNAIRTLGQAAVPVNLLMLGSNLSKGADFRALPVGMAIGLWFDSDQDVAATCGRRILRLLRVPGDAGTRANGEVVGGHCGVLDPHGQQHHGAGGGGWPGQGCHDDADFYPVFDVTHPAHHLTDSHQRANASGWLPWPRSFPRFPCAVWNLSHAAVNSDVTSATCTAEQGCASAAIR